MRRVSFMVKVGFAEEEARFLAGLVDASIPVLTDQQAEIARRIAGKFILAVNAAKDDLIAEHGLDAVLTAAEQQLAEWPDVEEVAL